MLHGGQRDLQLPMRRYALRDHQWDRIKDLLPGREGYVGVTAKDNRLFVEAVLYRYRAGIPWRDLPERFGDPETIHTRDGRWAKSGVWEKVFKHLSDDADNAYARIDPPSCAPTSTARERLRRGCGSSHRTLARRVEHQNPRHRRCARQSDRLPSHRWSGARSGWSGCVAP